MEKMLSYYLKIRDNLLVKEDALAHLFDQLLVLNEIYAHTTIRKKTNEIILEFHVKLNF
jgi:hypothetical protein